MSRASLVSTLVTVVALCALSATPAPGARRALPDLKPTSVRALRSEVSPGALLRVRERTKNVGRATSRGFSVRFLLSRDRRRGRDISLRGGVRTGRLRAGRSSLKSARVRIPGATAAGRYWVLACADSRRRVRERRERNNCRASSGRVSVVIAAQTQAPAAAPAPGGAKPSPPVPAGPLVAAVGDVACDASDPDYNGGEGTALRCRQRHVARLIPGASQFFALGDLQYEQGTTAQFAASWNVDFGAFKPITRPAIGNHEYEDPAGGAKGYFDYFNGAGNATGPAGDRTKGYYSFDAGSWHVVALNSNCGVVSCDAGSAQEAWLRADLAAHPARCTAAMWHHPLFSSVTDPGSGAHVGEEPRVAPLWKALRESGAELVLTGHSHTYERFAPMTETGATSVTGVREIVVGTGGEEHHPILPAGVYPTSQKRDFFNFGLLRLRLAPTGYSWSFVNESGASLDSGTTTCR